VCSRQLGVGQGDQHGSGGGKHGQPDEDGGLPAERPGQRGAARTSARRHERVMLLVVPWGGSFGAAALRVVRAAVSGGSGW
jgi:hypothetical protein